MNNYSKLSKKKDSFLLTSDKEKIAYYHYQNNQAKLIVIAHGFYNSKDSVLLQQLARDLSDGYDVFMFDFRGHGRSSGLFSWMSKESKDLEAVLNHLKGRYEKIGLVAFSLGGSISLNVLSETKGVDSLICVSAPAEFGKIDYKFWELDWKKDFIYTLFSKDGKVGKGVRLGPFWLKKKKPIKAVERIKIPVFYIHGDKDWVIKPWHSRALYKKTNTEKKLVVIKNGPHAEYLMQDSAEEFVREVKKWFKYTLEGQKRYKNNSD